LAARAGVHVADIFLSYSKKDHDQARLLAAALEAEGYSVWWDTSLLSGEQFRKTIMTELGKARAVIVIWTENSIHSDWVQSEAGRGHADRKLIPVKARGLSYRDIPPPFDNMHIENVDDREKIIAAIVAQQKGQLELLRSYIDAQYQTQIDVFQRHYQQNLQLLGIYYNTSSRLQKTKDSAQTLQKQIADGDEMIDGGTVANLQLLKVQTFTDLLERSATSSTGSGSAMCSISPTCILATFIRFWYSMSATLPLPSAFCYCSSGRC
jgi:hypothetical protein